MHPAETVLLLVFLTTLLAVVARKVAAIPHPIVMVVGGALLAFVPGLPRVGLDPQIVFLVFLPPLLYAAAYFTSWRDFRRSLPSISLLAVGLVAATTFVVGWALRLVVPDLPWAVAFTLGAIVSPPDAVAATAIAHRMHLPKRVITILEGESLVNDASGLVLFRLGVAAALSGAAALPLGALALDFARAAGGGILVGLGFAWLFTRFERLVHDGAVLSTATVLASFGTYILAESLHVSGVLAVVAAGLYQGKTFASVTTSEVRLQARGVWSTLIFLLEALAFIVIGLELPSALRGVTDLPRPTLVGAALAVSGATILVRLLWVFPGTYVTRLLWPAYCRRSPNPPWQGVLVVGWAGMRGVVSLAAALSLPLAFPRRDLVLLLTFAVIFATLVFQGLTLPGLIRLLGVAAHPEESAEEKRARLAMARAGLRKVDDLTEERMLPAHQVHPVRQDLEQRVRTLTASEHVSSPAVLLERAIGALRREALAAQRVELSRLRVSEEIGDDVYHRIEMELDQEEVRLR